jgi:hypothetical protein
MKKLSFLFGLAFFLLASTKMLAQSKPGADYFKGKWTMLIKGTPNGDAKMIFFLENKNDSITGVVQDSTGVEISKLSKVELKDSVITVYFTAQGYDVNVVMARKDDDHVTGSLMGMFDVEGERKKE